MYLSPWFYKVCFHFSVMEGKCTWVEKNDGSQAAQLSFVHLHVSHLAYELCQNPADRRGAKTREHFQVEMQVGKRKCQTRAWQRKRDGDKRKSEVEQRH